MAITFGSTRSTPRTWREAEGDRDDPRPGWLSAAEAGDPIHRRDCATVAPRTGAKAACTAPDGSGRPVVGRSVVARASAGPGLIAEHFTSTVSLPSETVL